tara:strand:- start:196 stop:1512 length:1317 start_codon:yes stop_codon:yes gene_type:complete
MAYIGSGISKFNTADGLTVSGDADIDGTANLDVVDIDGALTQDGGAVFNEASADVDFRVESNGNANMLFVDGGNNAVGIGSAPNTTFGSLLYAQGTPAANKPIISGYSQGNSNNAGIALFNDAGNRGIWTTGSTMRFTRTYEGNSTADVTIDASGVVTVGKTDAGSDVVGATIRGNGQASFTMDGNGPLILNRKSSDGDVALFQKDNSTVGKIGTNSSDNLYISTGSAGLKIANTEVAIIPANSDGSNSDNDTDLGLSGARYQDIFATNGTIQTSDENEKQDIASLTSAEITAAKAISALFKTFKWKDKVESKGDAARIHTGVIAQEVQTAMTNAGLDAADYAFWCSDTWWEASIDVPAVEASEEVLDKFGTVTTEAVEAKDAYTRIDTYYKADEAPDGATQITRMGIRYPELLAFVGAATEQRLANIETRLTALEAK